MKTTLESRSGTVDSDRRGWREWILPCVRGQSEAPQRNRIIIGTAFCALIAWIGVGGALHCAAESEISRAEHPPTPLGGRVGGGGGSGNKVSKEGRIGLVSYGQQEHPTTAAGAATNRVRDWFYNLAPTTVDHEGVYVWKGPDDVWSIELVSSKAISATVVISSDQSFAAQNTTATKVEATNALSITLSSVPGSTSQKLNFKNTGRGLTFDILIEGKRDTARTFLGKSSASPRAIPFTITVHAPTPNTHVSGMRKPTVDPMDTADGRSIGGGGQK